MMKSKSGTSGCSVHTKKNIIRLVSWTALWLATMMLAGFGPKFLWGPNQSLTILAILINLGVGIGMMVANTRHLDEMMKKIQYEAMGLSLAIGVVGGLSYSLLDVTNIISSHAEIGYLLMAMGLTYSAGMLAGLRRYR